MLKFVKIILYFSILKELVASLNLKTLREETSLYHLCLFCTILHGLM